MKYVYETTKEAFLLKSVEDRSHETELWIKAKSVKVAKIKYSIATGTPIEDVMMALEWEQRIRKLTV